MHYPECKETKVKLDQMGKRIRERRKELNLTQERLSEISGIGIRSIKSYESVRNEIPTLGTLVQLAQCLECEVSYLIGETPYPSRMVSDIASATGLQEKEAQQLDGILRSGRGAAFKFLLIEKRFKDLLLYFNAYSKAYQNPITTVKGENGEIYNAIELNAFKVSQLIAELLLDYGREEAGKNGNKEG